eukprot:TRINITY_DN14749_c0_g1_i2.p1 TRINITY_DN14749_c0_g1~~TRINITY_DN14749_c0_g1_i2.p1  ORF type:complete len:285 (-),score=86.01 TRINITY_DN14749_c0_g1_i2:171-1025(-)
MRPVKSPSSYLVASLRRITEVKHNQEIQRNYDTGKDKKYGANCKATIILMSGNKSNIGEVLSANNELTSILGYTKKEMIGSNISKAMPSIIGEKHNQLVQDYFQKQEATKNVAGDMEKLVFAMHKEGYLVPCTLRHKLIPNLIKGIQLIGFIFKADDLGEIRQGEEKVSPSSLAIVLTDSTWGIHGFDDRFARILHLDLTSVDIRRYLNAEEKLNIAKLVPDLDGSEQLEKMTSADGYLLELDPDAIRKEIEAEIDILNPSKIDLDDRRPEGSTSALGFPNEFP